MTDQTENTTPEPNETPQEQEQTKETIHETMKKEPPKEELPADIRNMAMLCHLLGLFGIIGPLLVWLIKKDDHPFLDENGKYAVNFHISLTIYYIILGLSVIGWVLIPVLMVLQIIFVIMGALKSSEGYVYKYPIAINFLK